MKHYKSPNGDIFAYESDGSQDAYIPIDFTVIPDNELDAYRASRAPILTAEQIRAQRDLLLSKCDWTQVADSPLTAEQKAVWTNYRSELRDVPEQSGFPASVVWPAVPN